MNRNTKLTVFDYSIRILMVLVALGILVFFFTSVISGAIAVLLVVLAIALIVLSITGFKKLKEKF
ncbi:hypothetical protein [Neptunitalea lumnitzerae]|uniref:Uncharacterized protein n=1 Tax=Neptunitalea lumnitzerae TaxID=2965509 RepID=A0ABQ5MIN9_9FLAO|nr:hypothetical protein [Neptunitalea sp. Y10]GLB49243.1 hypothetical protein Y10_16110 [Neptunitalea sp. Y10]